MSRPIEKLKHGSVSCAVWQNDNGMKSVTFQHSYKDKQGQWKNTEFIPDYKLSDLLVVVNALCVKDVLSNDNTNGSATYQQSTNAQTTHSPTSYDNDTDDGQLPF